MFSIRYPAYAYVHAEAANPLQEELLSLVSAEIERLQTLRDGRFTRSQDIENLLQNQLKQMGFEHAVTNKIRPGLFAESSDFEVDFLHVELAIALEVEKGKHFNIWRDVCKFAESEQIRHATLLIPYEKTSSKGEVDNIFISTLDSLQNIKRLYAGLLSFLLIGY